MDLAEFDEIFPEIVDCLTSSGMQDKETEAAFKWLKKVLQYNVPYGKKTRGMTVIQSFKIFAKKDKLNEENFHLASILGWCVELLQAFFLMADDVMDHSVTRRGKPCWYKVEHVGLMAINDAFAVEHGIYTILRSYFRNKDYYLNLVELFLQTTHQTIIGQCLDGLSSQANCTIDLNKYTTVSFAAIAKYKTSFYSFYLPVALGMYMAGISDERIHQKVKPILLQMGHLFQVQDDYLDCFGDPVITGKVGTDIEDGKCTWLIVTALQELSEDLKNILRDNYGKMDALCVSKVKNLYKDLKIPKKFHKYETECYEQILKSVNELEDIETSIFYEFLSKIYKREK